MTRSKAQNREYYLKDRARLLERARENYTLKRVEKISSVKKWSSKNKDKCNTYTRNWGRRNRDYCREYRTIRYKQDVKFRMMALVRNNTYNRYGKLPEGFVYHHIPPYRVDVWLAVHKSEHKNIDRFNSISSISRKMI